MGSKMTYKEGKVSEREFREDYGPMAIDGAIKQAIMLCWMMLPKKKRNAEAVEVEIRRLVDRALTNLKEDLRAFGLTE
jgi:hypothetical protein